MKYYDARKIRCIRARSFRHGFWSEEVGLRREVGVYLEVSGLMSDASGSKITERTSSEYIHQFRGLVSYLSC